MKLNEINNNNNFNHHDSQLVDLFKNLPLAAIIMDKDGKIHFVNSRCKSIFPPNTDFSNFTKLFIEDTTQEFLQELPQITTTKRATFTINSSPIKNIGVITNKNNHSSSLFLVFLIDTAQYLKTSKYDELQHLMLETAQEALWYISIPDDIEQIDNTTPLYWSNHLATLLGYPSYQELPFSAQSWMSHIKPEQLESRFNEFKRALAGTGNKYESIFQLKLYSGEYRWFKARGNIKRNSNNKAILVTGSLIDINNELIATTALNGMLSVIVTDAQNHIVHANNAFLNQFGYSMDEIYKKRQVSLLEIEDPNKYLHFYNELIEKHNLTADFTLKHKDGTLIPVLINIQASYDQDKKVRHYIYTYIDTTKEKKAQKEKEYALLYDELTKIPRFNLFKHKLMQILLDHQENDNLTIGYINIDDFSKINHLYGYDFGNKFLKEFAKRLTKIGTKLICHFSSDEFLFAFTNINDKLALETIIDEIKFNLCQPLDLLKYKINFNCSIGITTYNGACKNAYTLFNTLIHQANIALYKCKHNSRGQILYFNDNMQAELNRELYIAEKLPQAIKDDELYILYQPQINALNDKLIGVEALCRWNSASLKQVFPDEFIAIAEKYGIISELGLFVYKRALSQVLAKFPNGENAISVSVNISVMQLAADDFAINLYNIAREIGIDIARITIEITESIMVHDVKNSGTILNQLSNLGFKISMDDFGTGYSSLSYFNKLPLNEVKIDKSFIQNVLHSDYNQALIKAIVAISKINQLKVVAEGVDAFEICSWLANENINIIQGFLYGKPMPIDELKQKFT